MDVYYDEDADPTALTDERVAVLGYGIQGRAQALNLRDSGVSTIVGNRSDNYRDVARQDGFTVFEIDQAVVRSTLAILLLPDEVQPEVFAESIAPRLRAGDGVVFAHGLVLRYSLAAIPQGVDVLLLAPRMPGQYLRQRYLEGWGVPAFVSAERDASGRAKRRLLGLAHALGITRCAALEVSAAQETELDHFSEHFTYPAILSVLERAFEALIDAGYPPEAALMELHGSGELGQVLLAASEEGLFPMLESHASPACQAGIAHFWERAGGDREKVRKRIQETLSSIRDGSFVRRLVDQKNAGYPELKEWKAKRSSRMAEAEQSLHRLLRKPKRNG